MSLRSSVPTAAKRAAWNLKYGLLGYPHLGCPVNVIEYLRRKVTDESNILELGCGRGSLLLGLRTAGSGCHYCGVDISRYAIKHARAGDDQRSTWVVSDIESFRSTFSWDAIVLVESVYYISPEQLSGVFTRFGEMLTKEGFVLLRLHDVEQHADYLDALRQAIPGMQRIDSTLFVIYRTALEAAEWPPSK